MNASEIRVLHVDDEPDFGELTAQFLERVDDRITVETATSAGEGLERLADGEFHCVVSDYDMPGQNGIDFLESVREEHPDLPFVLFTGKGSEEVASEAISAGVSDYLQKERSPDQYSVLANRIANLVARSRAEARLETRAEQQRLVAELGKRGLAGTAPAVLFEDAVSALADGIGTGYAAVFEYRPDEEDLLLRAGAGWRADLVGETAVGTDEDSLVAAALRSDGPVVVEDGPGDSDAHVLPEVADVALLSGVSVAVGSPDDPWGVLGAYASERTAFTGDDVSFAENVGNVLTTAIERTEREREREATIEFLQSVYEVATDASLEFEEKVSRLLQVGPEKLGLPYGCLTRITVEDEAGADGTQVIVEASGDHDLLQPGESCSLSRSYCRRTIEQDDLMEVQNAAEAGWVGDPAYETFDLGCYIGMPITVDDELFGTVFFASSTPREEPYTEAERTFVRLLSQLVSYELERARR